MRRKLLGLVVLSIMTASASFSAGDDAGRGPEIIKLPMGDLTLPFTHWGHQKIVKNKCSVCHKSSIGKIENWGKSAAHDLCVSCHEATGKGPVQCEECHKVSVSRGQQEPVPPVTKQ